MAVVLLYSVTSVLQRTTHEVSVTAALFFFPHPQSDERPPPVFGVVPWCRVTKKISAVWQSCWALSEKTSMSGIIISVGWKKTWVCDGHRHVCQPNQTTVVVKGNRKVLESTCSKALSRVDQARRIHVHNMCATTSG